MRWQHIPCGAKNRARIERWHPQVNVQLQQYGLLLNPALLSYFFALAYLICSLLRRYFPQIHFYFVQPPQLWLYAPSATNFIAFCICLSSWRIQISPDIFYAMIIATSMTKLIFSLVMRPRRPMLKHQLSIVFISFKCVSSFLVMGLHSF